MSARRSVLPNFPDLVDKLDNRWLQMPTYHAERLRNGAGDLALRWEVARALALRTPQYVILSSVVAALKTHPILVIQRFPIGGDLVNPRCLCSSCYRCFSTQKWLSPLINLKALRADSAQPAKNSVSNDRRETHPCIGGPDGPGGVVSSISTSSRDEVIERPGWQPRGLPDLSNFD
jgi:hypothetical protein